MTIQYLPNNNVYSQILFNERKLWGCMQVTSHSNRYWESIQRYTKSMNDGMIRILRYQHFVKKLAK